MFSALYHLVRNKIIDLIKITREQGFIEGLRATINLLRPDKVYPRLFLVYLAYLKLRNADNLALRNIQGNKMYLDLSDQGVSKELIFSGIHEKLATEVLCQEVQEGMIAVDIGANIGYYALMEAAIVGEKGQVYAIEPICRNFNILNKNIRVNGYNNVKTFCVAVSGKRGTARMALTNASNLGTLLDTSENVISDYMKGKMQSLTRQIITIPTVSLDEFLSEQGVNRVNFVRMDLEGYEIEVIKGMVNILRNTPPPLKLLIEVHPIVFTNPESTIGPFLEQLLDIGFTPKYVITSKIKQSIKQDVRKDDFVRMVCSHSECPNILFEKKQVTETLHI